MLKIINPKEKHRKKNLVRLQIKRKKTEKNLRLPKATIKSNQTQNICVNVKYNWNSLRQIINLIAEVSFRASFIFWKFFEILLLNE